MTDAPSPPPPPSGDGPSAPASAPPPDAPASSADTGWPTPSSQEAPPAQDGRRPWWTGGRVVAAIVIVLVLMGLAAGGGFIAGAAWGGFNDVLADFETEFGTEFEGGLDDGFDSGFGSDGDVPGFTPLDTEVADGDDVQPGGRVSGMVSDRPVEHVLTVDSATEVHVEVVDADFDSVLVLLDAEGGILATDDDGGQDTLSAIDASLEPGTYAVRVQSWSGEDGGGYTLVVD